MKTHVSVKDETFKLLHVIVHLISTSSKGIMSRDRFQEPRWTTSYEIKTIRMYNGLREKKKVIMSKRKKLFQNTCLS